jgi:hypothetical protein
MTTKDIKELMNSAKEIEPDDTHPLPLRKRYYRAGKLSNRFPTGYFEKCHTRGLNNKFRLLFYYAGNLFLPQQI